MVKSTGTTKGMRMFNPKTHKLDRKTKGGSKSGMGGGF